MLKALIIVLLSINLWAYSEWYKCENNKTVIYMKSTTKVHKAYIVHCNLDFVKCSEFNVWKYTKCPTK